MLTPSIQAFRFDDLQNAEGGGTGQRVAGESAPDPTWLRRIHDVRFADELNRIDDIRTQSALPQTEIAQAGDNHFFRPLSA